MPLEHAALIVQFVQHQYCILFVKSEKCVALLFCRWW